MHEFDQGSMEYGSETGNWFGHCIKCHKDLIVYTGARAVKPMEAGPYVLAHTNGVGYDFVMQDFDLFVIGKPNAIIRLGFCK